MVIALRLAVVALAVTLAACQIDARTDGFRCDGPTDCTGGRTCVDGWCVDGDGGTVDAPDADPTMPDGRPDAMVCPGGCDSCVDGRCIIDCSAAGACTSEVTCPAGVPCTVDCSGVGSCAGGVDCTMSTDCNVECTAMNACGGAIACGTGPCLVRCTAPTTCMSDITCSTSCRCDVQCGGTGSCAGNEVCDPNAQCDLGEGCTSAPGPCHSC